MATVSVFWDTNMAAKTSCENTQFEELTDSAHARFSRCYISRALQSVVGPVYMEVGDLGVVTRLSI